jgi:hypothetical protein
MIIFSRVDIQTQSFHFLLFTPDIYIFELRKEVVINLYISVIIRI